ncbi:MAG: DUF58 domain-containing protein, partial [Verrucomicrobia bacterium]|nr:DUF58 domain-containing protein [Cytophagales bacterium]
MPQSNKQLSITQWFSNEELTTLKGLEWLARKLVQETLSGLHGSKRLGQGTDFSQYRTYMPGDDLRMIDWKAYARTDRLFLKESALESPVRWYGVLDASSSMNYEEGNITKWQYAKVLWAAITMIAKQQGDVHGLALMNDQEIKHIPPQAGKEKAVIQLLLEAKAIGKLPEKMLLPLSKTSARHKFVLITDLYEQHEELGTFIRSLLPARNEVTVFHVMGKQEISLDFQQVTAFEDAETGQRIQTDARQIRQEYQKQAADFIKKSRDQLLKWGAAYYLCELPESP